MHALRPLHWLACASLLLAATARADEPLRATVLDIDGEDVVVDLGAGQLAPSAKLTVYRAIEVRHPVTGKRIRDRFAIGELSVVQLGERLSIVRAVDKPRYPLEVGDVVESASPARPAPLPPSATPAAVSATPPPAPPGATAPAPSGAAAPALETSTAAADRVLVLHWRATLSRPPEQRARIYLTYLEHHPGSSYRAALLEEVRYLRALDEQLRTRASVNAASAASAAVAAPDASSMIAMTPLTGARAGRAVDVAALLRASDVRAVLLHVRPLEAQHGFKTQPMLLDARGHARARIPAELVRAPGFAFFVELIGQDGKPEASLGTASEPKIAVVSGPAPEPPDREPDTRVRVSSELVSFDGTTGRDYYFVNEGDFLYRLRRGVLYGVRVGYGTLRGEGGTVEELDVLRQEPRPAGFSYGFFEAELALHALFGLAARGTIGLGRPDDPASQRDGITGGFQVRGRIGTAEGTHLILAGEVMPEIGQRAYLGLAWEAIERVPMATEVVVTDQPVNSDELAVRLIYEAGYRISDRVAIALRPSYQLRTIRHAGPGIGMAATFDW